MIYSSPASTSSSGFPGAERHTKITPGEEARSATQPGVGTPPKNRARRAQQQVKMNFSSCSRLRQDCVCVALRALVLGCRPPPVPSPSGLGHRGLLLYLRAKRCHCIFTSRISTMQFFATLKLLLSNQMKKK